MKNEPFYKSLSSIIFIFQIFFFEYSNQFLAGYAKNEAPKVFCKIGALKNFANFIGKHQCWSLFLLKTDSNTGIFL